MNVQRQQHSLILVTVDCLRADHCGFYGYPRPTTPFLDALAAESFVVPTAVVAGAPTYYSFPAMLASRMPLALGRDVIGLAPGENTLATVLQAAGYATAAFSAANPYISPHFGYDQGFEVFRDFLDFTGSATSTADAARLPDSPSIRGKLNQSLRRVAEMVGLGRLYGELYFQYCQRIAIPPAQSIEALRKFPDAEAMVDQAIPWLTSVGPRPFFLWLHLMDPHSPYYPSEEAYRELTGRDVLPSEVRYRNEFWNRSDLTPARLQRKKNAVVDLYDAGIRWVDSQIARLVAHLRQQRQWDDCVFVLTADHGEEFLDHGGRYHAPVALHEEVTRVPLMIRVPGFGKNVPESPFSHMHLAPTLLEILDVPAPSTFQGRSLWRNLRQALPWDDPAVTECAYGCTNPFRPEDRFGPRLISVRDARYKLVMRIEAGVLEEIYDLKEDAQEKKPLPPGSKDKQRVRFLQAARKHLQETDGAADLAARLRTRLRDVRVELEQLRAKVS